MYVSYLLKLTKNGKMTVREKKRTTSIVIIRLSFVTIGRHSQRRAKAMTLPVGH